MKRIVQAQKRVLVLGESGMIASALAEHYVRRGAEVYGVDVRPQRVAEGRFSQVDIFNFDALEKIILDFQPDVILNGVNLATLSAKQRETGETRLIKFFFRLYKILVSLPKPVMYLQLGTTGSGGLGINIPFTHGDTLEDAPILHKAAHAGAISSLLVLLSRSFGPEVQIVEVKPGLSVFRENLVRQPYKNGELVGLDGGESGMYTPQELFLLTSHMGFTTVERLSQEIIALLEGKTYRLNLRRHDITAALNQTVIKQDSRDARLLQRITRNLHQLGRAAEVPWVIATGALGPPQVTRDLIFGFALINGWRPGETWSWDDLAQEIPAVGLTLGYLEETNANLYSFITRSTHDKQVQLLNERIVERKACEPWEVVLPLR